MVFVFAVLTLIQNSNLIWKACLCLTFRPHPSLHLKLALRPARIFHKLKKTVQAVLCFQNEGMGLTWSSNWCQVPACAGGRRNGCPVCEEEASWGWGEGTAALFVSSHGSDHQSLLPHLQEETRTFSKTSLVQEPSRNIFYSFPARYSSLSTFNTALLSFPFFFTLTNSLLVQSVPDS